MKTSPPGAKCFVTQAIYDNRNKNFVRELKEPTRVVAALVLGKEIKRRSSFRKEVLIQE